MQFYHDDAYLHHAVAEFTHAGLANGEAVVLIATTEHLAGIEALLADQEVDLDSARTSGTYITLDAVALLPTLMSGDMPDEQKFGDLLNELYDSASAHDRPVRMFGELVSLLALDSNYAAAIALETFWNALLRRRSFLLFCAYSMKSLSRDTSGEFLSSILGQHSHVVPAEGYSKLQTDLDRSREIIALQQKAIWLEAEVAARAALESKLQAALLAEREARAEAEAALELREEFLSVAAHDLRTPITVLLGHAQLLLRQVQRSRDRIEVDRVASTLETIARHADGLTTLVDQLLDVTRLDAGKLVLERQDLDLAKRIGDLVDGIRVCEPSRTITLRTQGDLRVQADPLRVDQIITNLVDNALKYSPPERPVIVSVDGTDADAVRISVRDYGPGIPEDARSQIFDRFFQVNGRSRTAGLGLGLYIATQMVDLHGGTLTAEFPDDDGSRFIVSLPRGS